MMPPVRDSKAMLVWAAKPVVGLGQFVPVFTIFVRSAVSWTCDATYDHPGIAVLFGDERPDPAGIGEAPFAKAPDDDAIPRLVVA